MTGALLSGFLGLLDDPWMLIPAVVKQLD